MAKDALQSAPLVFYSLTWRMQALMFRNIQGVIMMPDGKMPLKRPSDSYFELQAAMGLTKHMGGLKATDKLAEACRITEGQCILDVGCGLGRTACYLAKTYRCSVIGIDISERMVTQAKRRAAKEGVEDKVAFRTADASRLPFEASAFDAVIGESVMAFIEDKPRMLSELMRVTKEDGYIGFNECVWIKKPPESLIRYISDVLGAVFLTPDGWRNLWEASGLKEVTSRTCQVRAIEQWKNELEELEFKAYFGAWSRFIRLLFESPECRSWARKTLSMPRQIFAVFKYFGYGIFVGRKQTTEPWKIADD
jgi:ubiquinone/menaquinone biosynthesis C-methylase UbiE